MRITKSTKSTFNQSLLDWYQNNERPLPWKSDLDPYRIWLSEIILQQTRVAQGTPYYLKFIELFPDVRSLAEADEDTVLKAWEGLGYYSRARNLHATAKVVAYKMEGKFPDTYQGLLALKGIGPYTAAAIASFAYKLPHAVLDGNVFRVLGRFFGVSEAINSTAGKKRFQEIADNLIDCQQPDHWNQAMMNLGALVCTPLSPECDNCPLSYNCVAYREGRIAEFPIKEKALPRRIRHFHYLILIHEENTFIQKRVAKDIWKGLYQFPVAELAPGDVPKTLSEWFHKLPKEEATIIREKSSVQLLTHQEIHGHFYAVSTPRLSHPLPEDWIKIPLKAIKLYAFPKIIHNFIEQRF